METHTNPKLTLGPDVFSKTLMVDTPSYLAVDGRTFPFDDEQGCYTGLYVEPVNHGGLITEDSYYEIED